MAVPSSLAWYLYWLDLWYPVGQPMDHVLASVSVCSSSRTLKYHTVKWVNFTGNLISQMWLEVRIRRIKCRKIVKFTLTSTVSLQFSQNQIVTKLARICNSQKEKLNMKLACFTVQWMDLKQHWYTNHRPQFRGHVYQGLSWSKMCFFNISKNSSNLLKRSKLIHRKEYRKET